MKKTRLFVLAVLLLALVTPFTVQAQEKVEASVGADVVSSYVWRGMHISGASIQPSLSLDYKGFSLSGWGSVAITGEDYKEFDLTFSYTTGGLTIGLTDYWTDYGTGYFQYAAHNTDHVLNASIGYDFGPLSLTWDTNLTGADAVDEEGKRVYSSYIQLAVPFSLGGLDWTAEVGATPWGTDYYMTSGFSVCDISLGAYKELKVTDHFSLPIFAKATWNPCLEDAFFVFGISF
ncbi:MAG: hypothetical protein E7099_01135 [Mediterranea massiliensis]|nr:hypothetical protein [Mediterranea massiliensis]